MPKMNGFEVLESIPSDNMPHVIFTTAYDEFALKAFEYNTVDYLLKPYSDDRFYRALEKARNVLTSTGVNQSKIEQLIHFYRSRKEYRKRLPVKTKEQILLLEVEDIQWIKAADGYLEIGTHKKTYLTQESLKNLELQLDPKDFVRIHRSTILNLNEIHALEPYFNGEYHVILKDNSKFKLSRNYKTSLEKILDNQ